MNDLKAGTNDLKIKLENKVWWKIFYLTHKIKSENLGILTGTVNDQLGEVVIENVHIIEQQTTMAHCQLDLSKYAVWMAEHPDENEKLIGWYHSHNDMDTFYSYTDHACIKMFLKHLGIVVSLVSARKRQFPYIQIIYRIDGNINHYQIDDDGKPQRNYRIPWHLNDGELSFPENLLDHQKYLEVFPKKDLLKKINSSLDKIVNKNTSIDLLDNGDLTIIVPQHIVTDFLDNEMKAGLSKNEILQFVPSEIVEEMAPYIKRIDTPQSKPIDTQSKHKKLTDWSRSSSNLKICPICEMLVTFNKAKGFKICKERMNFPYVHTDCCGNYTDCGMCISEHPTPDDYSELDYSEPDYTVDEDLIPRAKKWKLGRTRWVCPVCDDETGGKSKAFKTYQGAEDHIRRKHSDYKKETQ